MNRPDGAGAIVLPPGVTVRDAIAALTRAFAQADVETPGTDARYLVQGVLGLAAGDLIANPGLLIGVKRAELLSAAANRRLDHEPVARILGTKAFYGRDFIVTPDVLDPRPDTETVIEAVLAIADREGWRERPVRICDIGTGSGAILVTLLAELPLASGVATDLSPAALAVARRNAARHGVGARFEGVETSTIENVAGPFDLIVSNPPYIPAGELPALAPEVRDYDPALALDGGPDGLRLFREIAKNINKLPLPVWVVLEIGMGQEHDVAGIFCQSFGQQQVGSVSYRRDLGGHVRAVTLKLIS